MNSEDDEDFLNSNIMEIDWEIWNQLVEILDTQNVWKRLLAAVPVDNTRPICAGKIEREGMKPSCSPSKLLLQELSSRGGVVKDLIILLEKIDVISALLLIKPDEPLVIIEEPQAKVEIEVSDKSILQLTCTAKGFPTPCYQWFKDDVELITQQEPSLIIRPISLHDSGVYYCRVAKHNRMTDSEDFILSREADVQVRPGSRIDTAIRKYSCDTGTDEPRIIVQPISPSQDKIVQGSTLSLSCKGRSKHVLHYQWYCDGSKILGETSSELKLANLYPVRGQIKWNFQCEVMNDYGKVLSDVVAIQLDVAQENTRYFAKDKVALLIANEDYLNLQSLELPSADVKTVSQMLTELSFRVLSFVNLNLVEMRNAVELFCQQLSEGAYSVFFYAGHGFEQYGQSYFQPVDASRLYSTEECLCLEDVLKCVQETNPAFGLFIIDTCRTPPPQNTCLNNFPIPGIIYKPKMTRNLFFSYSTSPFCSAHDISGQENGPYVRLLKKHLNKKIPIIDIVLAVHSEMEMDLVVGDRQCPWFEGNIAHRLTLHDEVLENNASYQQIVEQWKSLAVLPSPREIILQASSEFKIQFHFHRHKSTFWNALDIEILFDPVPKNVDFAVTFTNDEIVSIVETRSSGHMFVQVMNLQKLKKELHCVFHCVDKKTKVSHVVKLDLGFPLVAKKFLWQNSLSGKHCDESLSCIVCPTVNDLIDL